MKTPDRPARFQAHPIRIRPSGLRAALLALAAVTAAPAVHAQAQGWEWRGTTSEGNVAANWEVFTSSEGIFTYTGAPSAAPPTSSFGADRDNSFYFREIEGVSYDVAIGNDWNTPANDDRFRRIYFESETPYTLYLYSDTTETIPRSLRINSGTARLYARTGDHTIKGSKTDPNNYLWLRTTNFDISEGASLTLDVRLRTNASSDLYRKLGAGRLIVASENGGGTQWTFSGVTDDDTLGGFRVEEGTLVLAEHRASGATGNCYKVHAGAMLEFAPPPGRYPYNSYNGNLILQGAGVESMGALYVSETTGISSGTGAVVLDGNASIGVAEGMTLTLEQNIQSETEETLTKVGAGTLELEADNNAINGPAVVAAGTLLSNHENNTLGGSVQVNGPGTLAGRGIIFGSLSVEGVISPGAPDGIVASPETSVVPGSLRVEGDEGCTLAADSTYDFVLTDWNGTGENGKGWGLLDVYHNIEITATEANRITLVISGWPANFEEENKTFTFASSSAGAITGFDEDAFEIDDSGFIGNGTWQIVQVGNNLVLEYTAGSGTPYTNWAAAKGLSGEQAAPGEDADGDGLTNLMEFAFDGDPLSGANDGKVVGQVAQVGGQSVLTLTLPVHAGADFDGSPAQESDPVQGTVYRIEASENLVDWDVVVSEVTGPDAQAIQGALPGLTSEDWEYRTFRVSGTVSGSAKRFIRAVVE